MEYLFDQKRLAAEERPCALSFAPKSDLFYNNQTTGRSEESADIPGVLVADTALHYNMNNFSICRLSRSASPLRYRRTYRYEYHIPSSSHTPLGRCRFSWHRMV